MLVALADFERFVFVMSVLEGYSDQDCSVLLGCSEQDVRETRTLKTTPARSLQAQYLTKKIISRHGESLPGVSDTRPPN